MGHRIWNRGKRFEPSGFLSRQPRWKSVVMPSFLSRCTIIPVLPPPGLVFPDWEPASLLGYGSFLTPAPLEFRKVVGLYIATLFIVWQVINFTFFRTVPTLHVLAGGVLIR